MGRKVNLSFTDENFTFETEYGYKFYFSSMLHTVNYSIRYRNRRKEVAYQLNKVYKLEIDPILIADLLTYQTIETRGCKFITDEGVVVKCLNDYRLSGMKLTKKGLIE